MQDILLTNENGVAALRAATHQIIPSHHLNPINEWRMDKSDIIM
jgi:hypothetical protein